MTATVLDASAVLAYLQGEPGGDLVGEHLSTSLISAVNLSEIVAILIDKGLDAAAVDATLDSIGLEVVAFDAEQGRFAGLLRGATRKRGLSLGDRACLALARSRGVPVLTSDRAWAEVVSGAKVRLIR